MQLTSAIKEGVLYLLQPSVYQGLEKYKLKSQSSRPYLRLLTMNNLKPNLTKEKYIVMNYKLNSLFEDLNFLP